MGKKQWFLVFMKAEHSAEGLVKVVYVHVYKCLAA